MKRLSMRSQLRLIIIGASFTSAVFATEMYMPQVLSPVMMKTQLVGNTVRYQEDGDDIYEYYNPNGTIYGDSKKYGKYTGKWEIRDNGTFCFFYEEPETSGCVFVVRQPSKITYFRYLEDTEGPYDFIKGNPKKL